jgi:hypothetical protein
MAEEILTPGAEQDVDTDDQDSEMPGDDSTGTTDAPDEGELTEEDVELFEDDPNIPTA